MSSPTDSPKPAPGPTSTSNANKKDDSPAGAPKKGASSSGSGRPRQQGSNHRSNSRGGDNSGDASPTDERKPQQGGQRQQQHNRRPSRGGGQAGGNRRGSGGAQSGQQQQQQQQHRNPATNESLSNLKSLISDMRQDGGSPSGAAGPHQGGSPSSSPARSRSTHSHRKNPSSGQVPPAINAPPPAAATSVPQLAPSALNPNAGGFHPGSLSVISDINEGLVTPTASRFDLMTNQPYSPPGSGGVAPQDMPGSFGSFAAYSGAQQQQQHQAHAQALALQQQQFQLAQLAAGMNPGGLALGGAGGTEASELIAEQLAIQQQLASLKLQQESLMARFGDMQATLLSQPPPVPALATAQAQAQVPPPSGPSGQHRRVSSQAGQAGPGMGQHQRQPSGAMGQFTFPANPPGGAGESPSQPARGHARRTSLQASGQGIPPPQQQQQQQLGGGFQFPPRAGGGGGGGGPPPGQQQPQQQGTPQRYGGGGYGYGGGLEDEYGSGNDSPSQGRQMGHQRRQSGSMASLGGWSTTISASPS